MSLTAFKWALAKGKAYQLDQTTRHVALVLGNFAHSQTGNIHPSLATLADETGLSERHVRRCIQKLIDVGLLDYGDQSVVAHYRADKRPKVYQFTMDRAARQPDLSKVGQMPKKKRPWSRKPKPVAPVDNPAAGQERPVTVSPATGQAGGLVVHQSFKSLKTNPAHAAAGPAEVDHDAGYRLRVAIRERLARKGMQFTDHLFAPMPA